MSTVWFFQDIELQIPCATIILSMRRLNAKTEAFRKFRRFYLASFFSSLLPRQSAEFFNYLRLLEKVLHERVLEVACDAKHAGMSHKIEAGLTGLTVRQPCSLCIAVIIIGISFVSRLY